MSSVSYFEEEYILSDGEDESRSFPGLANGFTPGLLVRVEYDSLIEAPVIDNGVVRMPSKSSVSGEVPLAYFGSGIYSPVAGVVKNMYFSDAVNGPCAYAGEVAFPLANNNASVVNAGAIRGIYPTPESEPYINKGDVYFPSPPGVSFGGGTTQKGLLKTISFVTTAEPYAVSGVVYFPKANGEYFGVVGGCQASSSITAPYFADGHFVYPESWGAGGTSILSGMVDYNGSSVSFDSLGDGGVMRTVISRNVLINTAGHSVYVALTASFANGYLALNIEPWDI